MAFELALQTSLYVWVMMSIQKIAKSTLGKSDLVKSCIKAMGDVAGGVL